MAYASFLKLRLIHVYFLIMSLFSINTHKEILISKACYCNLFLKIYEKLNCIRLHYLNKESFWCKIILTNYSWSIALSHKDFLFLPNNHWIPNSMVFSNTVSKNFNSVPFIDAVLNAVQFKIPHKEKFGEKYETIYFFNFVQDYL